MFHTWQVHPVKKGGWKNAIVGLAVPLAALGAGALMGSVAWGIGGAVILLLSLHRYFLPTTYRLDDEGVEISSPLGRKRRPWSVFRRVVAEDRGLFLSRTPRPSRIENLRGVFLLWDGRNEDVTAFARERVAVPSAGGKDA